MNSEQKRGLFLLIILFILITFFIVFILPIFTIWGSITFMKKETNYFWLKAWFPAIHFFIMNDYFWINGVIIFGCTLYLFLLCYFVYSMIDFKSNNSDKKSSSKHFWPIIILILFDIFLIMIFWSSFNIIYYSNKMEFEYAAKVALFIPIFQLLAVFYCLSFFSTNYWDALYIVINVGWLLIIFLILIALLSLLFIVDPKKWFWEDEKSIPKNNSDLNNDFDEK